MSILRDYQREAIDNTFSYWGEGGMNPLIVMATGTGKSVVLAHLIKELIQNWPTMRVLMMTHVQELVEQNAKAMIRVWPECPIGINSAGLRRRDWKNQVLFASVQSVYRSPELLGPRDLVLIDEAHLVPKNGMGQYLTVLRYLSTVTPDMRVAGFTATPYRMDTGRLDIGDDRIFSDIVINYGIGEGIRDGFLSPLISKATVQQIDVSGVGRRGGEFIPGALELAADKEWITKAAVNEIIALGQDRKSWLAFCCGVDHAEHVAEEIRSRGISCETVTGQTPNAERKQIISSFKAGRIRCLTNAMVLTTGFDAPAVDLIAMLRPTLSTGLYVQIMGRGTRLHPGKTNCLVLDFAGNVRRHGPVDQCGVQTAWKKAEAEEDVIKSKVCSHCMAINSVFAAYCIDCGQEFVQKENTGPKHDAIADAALPIMSSAPPEWIYVTGVNYYRHTKPDKFDSLRVEYQSGIAFHRDWVCFDHPSGSFPKNKAERWWYSSGGLSPAPSSVKEAIERSDELRVPSQIMIKPEGRFFKVVDMRFEQHRRVA